MDELVKRLRAQAVYLPEKFSKNAELLDALMKAADAIEQLSKDLERSKEYETFWEKEANEALKKFQTTVASIPRWIPVTERLPERFKSVLTVDKYGVITFNWISGDGKNWSTGYHITHWMPLPEPPKEEGE